MSIMANASSWMHVGSTALSCCENDSMLMLHFPLASLAGVSQRWDSYARY